MDEVGICNLALANIGDVAQVTSITPPDGSVQAALCSRFYASTRDAVIESAPWKFCLKRVALASVPNPTINNWTDDAGNPQTSAGNWQYAYALPSDCASAIAILPPNATDDYEEQLIEQWQNVYPGYPILYWQGYAPIPGAAQYVPQPYAIETDSSGRMIVLTNTEFAILRYSAYITDTTKFSALFTTALSCRLAARLAGPIIKGEEGAQIALAMTQEAEAWEAKARSANGNQRKIKVTASPDHIRYR